MSFTSLMSLRSLLFFLLAFPSAAAALSPEETRGKQIYTLGTSASGVEIKAALGDEGNELPASALPCAGCHGLEGHGGREGGVRPSDLTREALGRPAVGERGGRRHPPYDDHLLIRAITLGVDPAGNRLHVAMPRYRLTQKDAADLLAYLKRLGHEDEPGLEPGAVHLGVLLPGGARAEEAAAVRAALTARGAEIDRGGGIYGRRLALDFVTLPEPPAERAAKLRERLANGTLFALIGTDLSGAEGGAGGRRRGRRRAAPLHPGRAAAGRLAARPARLLSDLRPRRAGGGADRGGGPPPAAGRAVAGDRAPRTGGAGGDRHRRR